MFTGRNGQLARTQAYLLTHELQNGQGGMCVQEAQIVHVAVSMQASAAVLHLEVVLPAGQRGSRALLHMLVKARLDCKDGQVPYSTWDTWMGTGKDLHLHAAKVPECLYHACQQVQDTQLVCEADRDLHPAVASPEQDTSGSTDIDEAPHAGRRVRVCRPKLI